MKFTLLLLLFLIACNLGTIGAIKPSHSVYTIKPADPEAVYFTPEAFGIKADGKTDVSEALQKAINQVKSQQNFGVLFIPEGKYLISRTIHVPGAVRLIGYGKSRPEIILGKNTPGFQDKENFMIWFTGGLVEEGKQPNDAGAGTFYSAISNIDMRIENGNPKAIALRTHFAQHGFVSHCDLHIGNGMAGIYDVGNEMENVNFYGGDYGITTSRTSPGWPMMMVDLYFEGQRKAAVLTKNAGLTIVAMHVKNAPVGVELPEDVADRLYMENCLFENVGKGVVIGVEDNATNQINLLNIDCRNVPVIAHFTKSGKSIESKDKLYRIKDFTYGLVMKDMNDDSQYQTICETEPLTQVPVQLAKDIPSLAAMDSWVNIRELGAKGDGETDDTKAFQEAIAKHKNIYVPIGWYRLTETLKMNPGTKLIGFHPFATQLILKESEPAFSGFGAPKPLLESSEGGDDMVNGIGLNTGAYNNRAVGLKWMANEKSMINDVKFVGGHGTMRKPNTPREQGEQGRRERKISSPDSPENAMGMDLAWDNQYWSLWVTNGGGGTLKDIWTASTYAGNGFYVSNTSTPARVYAMSLEHHVRFESRMDKVSNWKLYAFQFEEEGREGKDCQSLEMNACKDILFANFWMYRVIRVNTPRPWGIKMSDCQNIEFRNMRNWTQVLHVPELTIFDMNKNLAVYPWDFARATITGNEQGRKQPVTPDGTIEKLAFGFEFATGAVADSKGNVYFCENRLKKIYKWSAETNSVAVYADYPYKPFSLAVDTKDNLLVICRYDPQPGLMVDGKQEGVSKLPDDNPMYSGWGNGGWAALAYAINPEKADDMQPLKRVKSTDVSNVKRVIYPTHRWRSDFEKVAQSMPGNSFLAPDGVTIVPETYDLGRSVQLMAVTPGQALPVYVSHEDPKITYRFEVALDGKLTNMQKAFPRGEYSLLTDTDGTLYLAEGQIFVFDKNGKEQKRINLDERPLSMAIGGKDKNYLFVTTSAAVYKVKIK
ncbi:MAG TPA: glycosyl hydrolase family 28-related protein [Prolixibacteraceae bacterium]|nr:glycosyl hydrolase family 28-related protein [Prolixibacteraceae bacterium]